MASNRLSRWTLLYFCSALTNFLVAQVLILAGLTWPAQPFSAPGTLIAVHLLAVGWLLLLMWGALFQFVPVITSRPLTSQPLALATLVAVQIGLIGMICGFLGITGEVPVLAPLLPAGGAGVLAGVLIAGWNVGLPLLRTRPLPLPGRMVLTGLAFLLVTVTLGLSFALALSVPRLAVHLGPLLAGLGDHALAGLGGWFTLTAMGVSYKLLPMFMLAPDERGMVGECVHIFGAAGFALAIGAGLAQVWVAAAVLRAAEVAGYVAIAVAIVIYLWDIVRIYRTRKRVAIEVHNKAAVGAFGFLGLATALAIVFLGVGRLSVEGPTVVFLVLFGWLGGLGLTQLYKIVPFLTWLGRYGSGLGRGPVPRVQDLVRESRVWPWFVTYFIGVLLAGTCALSGVAHAFRSCLALTTLATLGLAIEYWHAWRGHYVRLRPSTPITHQLPVIKEVDHG